MRALERTSTSTTPTALFVVHSRRTLRAKFDACLLQLVKCLAKRKHKGRPTGGRLGSHRCSGSGRDRAKQPLRRTQTASGRTRDGKGSRLDRTTCVCSDVFNHCTPRSRSLSLSRSLSRSLSYLSGFVAAKLAHSVDSTVVIRLHF